MCRYCSTPMKFICKITLSSFTFFIFYFLYFYLFEKNFFFFFELFNERGENNSTNYLVIPTTRAIEIGRSAQSTIDFYFFMFMVFFLCCINLFCFYFFIYYLLLIFFFHELIVYYDEILSQRMDACGSKFIVQVCGYEMSVEVREWGRKNKKKKVNETK